MNDNGVYDDEMFRKRPSDDDIERILSGQAPEDASLARLGTLLIALHDHEAEPPSEGRIATLAAQAAAIARDGKPDRVVATPPSRSKSLGVALTGKLAMVAVAIVVIAGMTGVATASDKAAPGDLLYGLDRALEAVGINDGGTTERITEAQALASDGQVEEAIDHVAAAVTAPDSEPTDDFSPESTRAATALRDAAARVRGDSAEPEAQEVRDAVGAMLSEMAEMIGDPDLDGAEFGQRVADMARSITNRSTERGGEAGQSPDSRPDHAGPPEGNDGEPAETSEGGLPGAGSGGGPPGEGPAGGGPPGGGPPGGGPPGRPGGR